MSQYHIDRIASVLDDSFGSLIDMSDWHKKPAPEARVAFLQRGMAALCIKSLAEVEDSIAAEAVVDGFDDGGIDALFFDQINDAFYFVQGKWSEDGTKPIDGNASGRFIEGVRDILSARRIERFNQKVKNKESEILAALRASRLIRIILVTAHTATQRSALTGAVESAIS